MNLRERWNQQTGGEIYKNPFNSSYVGYLGKTAMLNNAQAVIVCHVKPMRGEYVREMAAGVKVYWDDGGKFREYLQRS